MIKDYLSSRGAGIFRFTKRVIVSYSTHYCPRHAAALAYYTLFSLFPLLLLLVYITSYFFPSAESRQNLAVYLQGIFPYGSENLSNILDQTWQARRSMGVLSAVGLLWGGSSIFSVLETSLSSIWETKPRPYWRRRLLGILSVLAVVLVFLASTLVGPLTSLIMDGIPVAKQTISYAMQLVVVTIVAMLLYRIYPNENVNWSAAFAGAFSSSVLIVLAKFIFRFYTIIVTARSGLLYGSLTWFLTMALWVYLVGVLFLFGAEFSAAFQYRQKILEQVKEKRNDRIACLDKGAAMRTEQEMLDLILQYARADDNIRAVLMNGSRVNPNIQPDRMQDFDVVYYVREMAPLVHKLELPAAFGELAILQLPDEMGESAKNPSGSYAYLMQFRDGNRIDLSICPLDALADAGEDSLTVVLLDKDGSAPVLPPPSETSYLPRPPSAMLFEHCCNEFWWLMPYVAKALWRDELVNAQFFLELRRRELHKMLDWYYGTLTGYAQSPGKLGKRWGAAFGPELWGLIEQTYAGHQPENIWRALYAMGELFRRAAQAVAAHHGFAYPAGDDERVNELVRGIEGMGKDV